MKVVWICYIRMAILMICTYGGVSPSKKIKAGAILWLSSKLKAQPSVGRLFPNLIRWYSSWLLCANNANLLAMMIDLKSFSILLYHWTIFCGASERSSLHALLGDSWSLLGRSGTAEYRDPWWMMRNCSLQWEAALYILFLLGSRQQTSYPFGTWWPAPQGTLHKSPVNIAVDGFLKMVWSWCQSEEDLNIVDGFTNSFMSWYECCVWFSIMAMH